MTITSTEPTVAALWETLNARVARGMRFAGLFAAHRNGGITLSAHVAGPDGIDTLEAPLPPGAASYPALTPVIGAAFWYERVIHDETGLIPAGPSPARPAGRARQPGRPRAAPARRRLRHVHDPARPGPLRGIRVDGVPRRDPGRGDTAPEHADLLQAPRHRRAVRRPDRQPTACSWPSGPRASPPSRTPSPTATRSRRSPAARSPRGRPPSRRARRARADRQPPRRRDAAGRRGRAWRSPPPASRCTRSG